MAVADDIYQLLLYRKESTGGHNGYSIMQLKKLSGHSEEEIKTVLRELWEEKRIRVNQSINYRIIRLL